MPDLDLLAHHGNTVSVALQHREWKPYMMIFSSGSSLMHTQRDGLTLTVPGSVHQTDTWTGKRRQPFVWAVNPESSV